MKQNETLKETIRRKALTNFVKKAFRKIDKEMLGIWKVLESEGLIGDGK